jgi:hypothetical protein
MDAYARASRWQRDVLSSWGREGSATLCDPDLSNAFFFCRLLWIEHDFGDGLLSACGVYRHQQKRQHQRRPFVANHDLIPLSNSSAPRFPFFAFRVHIN